MNQEENDVRLEEVLADYLQAEESGQAPDRKQLLAQRPDLAEELTTFFECRQQVPRLWPGGPPQESPACIGDFTIEETLGQGAMGVVYKARQKQLPSLVVALKWMRASQRAGAENRSRFITGAEALAHLRHPNIVTIYQAGNMTGFSSMPWSSWKEAAWRNGCGNKAHCRRALLPSWCVLWPAPCSTPINNTWSIAT